MEPNDGEAETWSGFTFRFSHSYQRTLRAAQGERTLDYLMIPSYNPDRIVSILLLSSKADLPLQTQSALLCFSVVLVLFSLLYFH